MLDGKKVSEFKFMQNLKRELRGEEAKKSFYWTDKKVMLCFELCGLKIKPNQLSEIKKQIGA
jgi:hypothetical protein